MGGTGQYIYSITEAWQIPEQEPDDAMRNVLEKIYKEHGYIELFRYLEVLDPIAALSIDKRNIRRVVRALEVIFMTGHKFSELKNKGTSPYHLIQMGIQWPREELYRANRSAHRSNADRWTGERSTRITSKRIYTRFTRYERNWL